MASMYVVAIVWAGAGGVARAAPLVCPPDTQLRSADQDGEEQWCERSDGTRHGGYRRRSGPMLEEGDYADGERDGVWVARAGTSPGDQGVSTEELHYERGVKHGLWTARYDNRVISGQGEYRGDAMQGTWRWWYRDGTPRGLTSYRDGLEHGHATRWDEHGAVVSDGEYDAGKQVGLWLVHSADPSFDAARGRFCADQRCGRWRYYLAGQLAMIGDYRDGRRDRRWRFWSEGELREQGSYTRGRRSGRWTRYRLGTPYKRDETDCRDGIPHGERRAWFDNGKLALSGAYIDGKADGAWAEYDHSGRPGDSARFQLGELVPGSLHARDARAFDPGDADARERCSRTGDRDEGTGDTGEDGDDPMRYQPDAASDP